MKQKLRLEAIAIFEAVFQFIMGRPRCQPFMAIKRLALKAAGVSIGRNVTIYPGAWIMPPSKRLTIGDNVDISKDVMITVGAPVHIGSGSLIGYGSKILSSNHRIPEPGTPIFSAGHERAPINIGKDVWIGANVVVLAGTTIGEGTVVAAGSVVTKDLPSNVIAGGIPARAIKSR